MGFLVYIDRNGRPVWIGDHLLLNEIVDLLKVIVDVIFYKVRN